MTARYDFTGQSAVITGGARGIGRSIAERLAADGARVVIWDLKPEHFDQNANDFHPEAVLSVDVAEPTSVDSAFRQTLDVLGHVDIVVNNAGIVGPYVPVWELDAKLWQRVLDINLSGVFNTCRAAVPHLRQRGTGRIINIASMAGKDGNALQSAYSPQGRGDRTHKITRQGTGDKWRNGQRHRTGRRRDGVVRGRRRRADLRCHGQDSDGPPVQVSEIANLAPWIASDDCSFTTGFTFDISGGRATYYARPATGESNPAITVSGCAEYGRRAAPMSAGSFTTFRELEDVRRQAIVDQDLDQFAQLCHPALAYSHSSSDTDTLQSYLDNLRTGFYVYHDVDHATESGVTGGIDEVLAPYDGRVDVLFNNVGAGSLGTFDSLTDCHWVNTLQLNFLSQVRATTQVLPGMRAAGAA